MVPVFQAWAGGDAGRAVSESDGHCGDMKRLACDSMRLRGACIGVATATSGNWNPSIANILLPYLFLFIKKKTWIIGNNSFELEAGVGPDSDQNSSGLRPLACQQFLDPCVTVQVTDFVTLPSNDQQCNHA